MNMRIEIRSNYWNILGHTEVDSLKYFQNKNIP